MKVLADKNWEYKYISDLAITVQKLLNQWKHEFELAIIHIEFAKSLNNETYINMLIARRRKNYDL